MGVSVGGNEANAPTSVLSFSIGTPNMLRDGRLDHRDKYWRTVEIATFLSRISNFDGFSASEDAAQDSLGMWPDRAVPQQFEKGGRAPIWDIKLNVSPSQR